MNPSVLGHPRPMPMLADAELVGQVIAGDAQAFRILMQRHNQLLYRTARSIVRNEAEAEDVVQEGWLQAYRALHEFRGDSKLATWLVRIVANEALGRLRGAGRRAEVIPLDTTVDSATFAGEPNMQVPESERPDHLAERGEIRRVLEARIDELPDAFRSVFVLRAVEEMSVDEVAAVLGIPEATVRTRHFRARSMLRESLAREVDVALADAFSFAGERCDRIVAGVFERLGRQRVPDRPGSEADPPS
ncbi:MAG: RNA polymerase sigma factor [Burkholderiaceae bacterium]|nr:RNA polymerase sigma factor [Burkholderiaceae bacterium]